MFTYPLIKHLHEETKNPMGIPADEKDWPESWKTVEFKEYPRMPQIVLPNPDLLSTPFGTVLEKRRSRKNFDSNVSLSLRELSTLLHFSAGISRNKETPERSFRFYPSGGGLYPLEIYLSLKKSDEIDSGIYHYNVRKHSLEKIHNEKGAEMLWNMPTYPWVKDAAALVFITAIFNRNMQKYRERGYRFIHIEAGALFYNFYLVSEAYGLGCCGVGATGYIDDIVCKTLDLDTDTESMISLQTIGRLRA